MTSKEAKFDMLSFHQKLIFFDAFWLVQIFEVEKNGGGAGGGGGGGFW